MVSRWLPRHADIGHDDLLNGNSTVADNCLRLPDKGVPTLCYKRQERRWKTYRRPTDGLGEGQMDSVSNRFIWENVCSLASLLGDHTDIWLAHAARLDVSMICCNVNLKICVD